MKKLMILSLLLLLAACNIYNTNRPYSKQDKACELVKDAFGEKFTLAAGAFGSVKYSAFAYDNRDIKAGEDSTMNPDVYVVDVKILKVERRDSTNLKIQYLTNVESGVSEFSSGEIDGEPASLMQISFQLLTL